MSGSLSTVHCCREQLEMPEIKHQVDIYFNLRARGESCRLLLAYGGLQYEDERLPPDKLEDPSVWARVKQTTP